MTARGANLAPERSTIATERFDILDCRGKKTGETIAREEAHRMGVWHGAFHGLIIYEREGRGKALFQKRAETKKIAPGCFDVSVGGHYTAGEEVAAAGPREIKEELGLDVKFGELVPVGRRIFVYCFTPDVVEHELQDVFLLPLRVEPAALLLQEEEVEGVIEVDVEQGIRLFGRETGSIECRFFRGRAAAGEVPVFAAEFVPCLDNYYLKMLLLAKRYFAGERYLVI